MAAWRYEISLLVLKKNSKSSPLRNFFFTVIFSLIVTVSSDSFPILPPVLKKDEALIDCARKSNTV